MKKIKNTFSRSKAALAATGVLVLGAVEAVAAPVTLPVGADTDITSSITNGGDFALLAVLAVIGFGVIFKMVKKI
ncbi:hypothetical protein [Sulfurimonas sp.]|uniref:hypothetical protein n=1 Tax=Sulfurimonas sp. TaxID=2022749 RepID=UPI0019E1D50E|nr:hypothetical protein [Sulfurimonas sp.]MBE0515157.1 hypothetical protein [Sulfurimonas sp.]